MAEFNLVSSDRSVGSFSFFLEFRSNLNPHEQGANETCTCSQSQLFMVQCLRSLSRGQLGEGNGRNGFGLEKPPRRAEAMPRLDCSRVACGLQKAT